MQKPAAITTMADRMIWSVMALVWAGAATLALGGEPLRFSGAGKAADGPRQNPLEKYLQRPFESLRPAHSMSDAMMPVMPSPFTPPAARVEKDPKQNFQDSWIFQRPEDAGKAKTMAEQFNLPEYSADGMPKKKLSAMERYFQGKEEPAANPDKKLGDQGADSLDWQRHSQNSLGDPATADSLKDPKDRDRAKGREDRALTPTGGLQSIFGGGMEARDLAGSDRLTRDSTGRDNLALRDLVNELGTDARKVRQREERDSEFRRVMDLPDHEKAVGLGQRDPVLWQGDATRSEMNPVKTGGFERGGRASQPSYFSAGGGDGRPGFSRRDSFLEPSARAPGLNDSGAKPPAPPESSWNKRQPLVLPVPQRQF